MRKQVIGRVALILATLAAAIFVVWTVFVLCIARPEPVVNVDRGGRDRVGKVHFGGPDKPVGALSNLLAQRIAAMPAGGSIYWATYYFRDRDLARALVAAQRRGVRVLLVVDGDPRLETANDAALAVLRKLGKGLVVRAEPIEPFDRISGKLHTKIYAFDAPGERVAMIGSFNPSGDEGTDKATLDEIGDQDRGHNMLIDVVSPGLIDTLIAQVRLLGERGGSIDRFDAHQNRIYRDRDTRLYFYPRLRADIVEDEVDRLDRGDRLWAAISHLKGDMVDRLARAAERRVEILLVVHDTERRVPESSVRRLNAAGVHIRRYRHPDGLPMHAKFIVVERDGGFTSYTGSINYNRNSRLLNDEVLMVSRDPQFAVTLLERLATIEHEIGGWRTGGLAQPAR
ncbi:phospholipase D-like domain-containing protein [Sphingomonas montanisoli]|uniref:Phospholipase D n=1 Tax=Sphingomonas montanisoli TaxID=2606412 RepID=A0A5D9C4W5_9SPHN|nr:phospholipase D-like domain-containing protein [Sphingomonas montanisoli]TZG26070.1 phosphatidylserine/phosphatidylglycerophosphate/cardiolipin synthase family protein [Sphingomonas montanisoli]